MPALPSRDTSGRVLHVMPSPVVPALPSPEPSLSGRVSSCLACRTISRQVTSRLSPVASRPVLPYLSGLIRACLAASVLVTPAPPRLVRPRLA